MGRNEVPVIRPGNEGDTTPVNRIYNHYVLHTTATFDIEPWSDDKRQAWILGFAKPYFLMVAEASGEIVGFAHNGKFRPKAAYDSSTDVTVYTAPDAAPPGTGTALYQALFERLNTTDLHRAYAIIALPNASSIALHEKFGFNLAGVLGEVGTKFGRRVDVAWYEKPLPHR